MTSFCYEREPLNKNVAFLTKIEALNRNRLQRKISVDSNIGKDDTDAFRKGDKGVFTDQKGR